MRGSSSMRQLAVAPERPHALRHRVPMRRAGSLLLVAVALAVAWWIGVLVQHLVDPLGTGARRDAVLFALPKQLDRLHVDTDALEREVVRLRADSAELRRENAELRDALDASPYAARERASTL